MISALVNAYVDGDTPTAAEIGSFFILLIAAGSGTTPAAIAHGLVLPTEYPGENVLEDPKCFDVPVLRTRISATEHQVGSIGARRTREKPADFFDLAAFRRAAGNRPRERSHLRDW